MNLYDIAIERALALLYQNPDDPQAARRQADQQGDLISSQQWLEAEIKFKNSISDKYEMNKIKRNRKLKKGDICPRCRKKVPHSINAGVCGPCIRKSCEPYSSPDFIKNLARRLSNG